VNKNKAHLHQNIQTFASLKRSFMRKLCSTAILHFPRYQTNKMAQKDSEQRHFSDIQQQNKGLCLSIGDVSP
jgi:hypothetical protein